MTMPLRERRMLVLTGGWRMCRAHMTHRLSTLSWLVLMCGYLPCTAIVAVVLCGVSRRLPHPLPAGTWLHDLIIINSSYGITSYKRLC